VVRREERDEVGLVQYKNAVLSIVWITLVYGPAQQAISQNAADRRVANAGSAKVIIPHESWTCGMAEGIPNPESGTLVFEAEMKFERVLDVGRTPYGKRQVVVMQGGVVSGPKLSGVVMPGALDFELKLSNGTVEVEQTLVLRTSDGSYVYGRTAGAGADAADVRVVMDFEAPNASSSAWLNSGKYVARRVLNAAANVLTMRVYDVSTVTIAAADLSNAIKIRKPEGVPNQAWDYRRPASSEKQGNIVVTETVTLAPSQSVGASKRGNRNIIPLREANSAAALRARCCLEARIIKAAQTLRPSMRDTSGKPATATSSSFATRVPALSSRRSKYGRTVRTPGSIQAIF
jgi:hypothetical protein